MSALSAAQQQVVAAYWAQQNFVAPNVTATFHLGNLSAAVASVDNALDTTLSNAVIAVGGGTTVIQGLADIIPAPFNTASAQQQALLVCYTIMARYGLIPGA